VRDQREEGERVLGNSSRMRVADDISKGEGGGKDESPLSLVRKIVAIN